MRTITLTLLLVIYSQLGDSKLIYNGRDYEKDNLKKINILEDHKQNELRDLSEKWNKIKTDMLKAWESVKNVAHIINNNLKIWLDKVKEKVKILQKRFEEHIEVLKNEIKTVIKQVLMTGETIKVCIKADKDIIENILKGILINVTKCVTKNIYHFNTTETLETLLDTKEKYILSEVQNKFDKCATAIDQNYETCFHDVKNEVLATIKDTQENLTNKEIQIRNDVDDKIATIEGCVIEGVLKAAGVITIETVKIVNCVKN